MKYTGRSAAAVKYTLPLLDKLAMVEETLIRQAVISSLSDVDRAIMLEGVHCGNGVAMAILTRLAETDWFISRVLVSLPTPSLYAVLTFDEERTQILKIRRQLCTDDMPLRQCLVGVTLKIAEKTVTKKQQDIVLTLVRAAVKDDMWLPAICKHLAPDKVVGTAGPHYTKLEELLGIKGMVFGGPVQTLASDSVAEVREAMAEQISFIWQNTAGEVMQAKLLQISNTSYRRMRARKCGGTCALSLLYALLFVYLTTCMCASLFFRNPMKDGLYSSVCVRSLRRNVLVADQYQLSRNNYNAVNELRERAQIQRKVFSGLDPATLETKLPAINGFVSVVRRESICVCLRCEGRR